MGFLHRSCHETFALLYDGSHGRLDDLQVGRQVGLQSSAIRYYERIGILPKAQRVSGQRRYDTTVLNRLAVVQRARLLSALTLDEIRELFFSFRQDTRASARWQKLSQAKLAQLAELEEEIATVRRLLHRLRAHCDCETLDQCGRRLRKRPAFLFRARAPPNNGSKEGTNRHRRQCNSGNGGKRMFRQIWMERLSCSLPDGFDSVWCRSKQRFWYVETGFI